jgi:hypothetical protein
MAGSDPLSIHYLDFRVMRTERVENLATSGGVVVSVRIIRFLRRHSHETAVTVIVS